MAEDNPGGASADTAYAVLFESAWRYIETSYHGLDAPDANIEDCLTASLELYDADLAFILELDEELEAGQYLYVKSREGFDLLRDSDETLLYTNLFTDIIRRNEPFCFTDEALKEPRPEEYGWLLEHGIKSAMAVPFKTRTNLVAFFGVHNARRFYGKTSFLTLSTKALGNEIRALRMKQLTSAAKFYTPELAGDDVVIKLFGGFDIYTKHGSLSFTDISSVQCSRFLLYLIKNRSRTIPVREIADVLWPDQLIDNPYGMVKGVAFRVRKILDSICPDKLVVAKSGTYAVNDQLTLIIDTEEFDLLCDRVHSSKLLPVDRQLIYERILRVYKGDMLPNYESEIWLIGWIGYYQMKYLEILKEFLTLLKETTQYAKIFEVVSNVLSICYDDGEIYAFLIDALIMLNKPELAKSYYVRVEKLLTPEQKKYFIAAFNDCKK